MATSGAPKARTAWTAVAVEMLSDRKWHYRDNVIFHMSRAIPPELARDLGRDVWARPSLRDDLPLRLEKARTHVALKALSSLVRTGKVETRLDSNGDVSVRAAW